ncbi:hypothetical protein RLIN73S_07267 [Rhodanobacter lindaniclasticus]
MNDTAVRYLQMVLLIPRFPNSITATKLHQKLQDLGHKIDKRSIERDLNKLSSGNSPFPLTSSEGRPAQWSWLREAEVTHLPALNPATALTLELAHRHLAALLPHNALVALEPLFKSARKVLDETAQLGLARWSDKVAAVPENQPLLPASISASVHETIHQALLTEKRLEISYRAAGQERPKRYPVNPLGLVSRGGAYYLVATARDYPDPRNFARTLLRPHPARLAAGNTRPDVPIATSRSQPATSRSALRHANCGKRSPNQTTPGRT